jgi:hypothetical protein
MPYRASELMILAEDGTLARFTADGFLIRMARCE